MSIENKKFWKFILLYLTSIILVGVAVYKHFKSTPKMQANYAISAEKQLVNQQKLLFKVQKINDYFGKLDGLEEDLKTAKDAQKIGKLKTEIDKTSLKASIEISKYRYESEEELYVEIFKNFDRLIDMRKINDGLRKENLYTKEELDECKQISGTTVSFK